MQYGQNGFGGDAVWLSYAQALERAREAGTVAREAEGSFSRSLPPGATVRIGAASLPGDREVRDRREAFRAAHEQQCRYRRLAGEWEEDLFPFAEDRHQPG